MDKVKKTGLLKRIYDILSNKGNGSWTAQNVGVISHKISSKTA